MEQLSFVILSQKIAPDGTAGGGEEREGGTV